MKTNSLHLSPFLKRKNFFIPAILLSTLWGGQFALAGTDTATFQVKLNILSTCDIHSTAPTDVDFGTHLSTATDITAIGELKINCTNGTAYDIGLNQGNNFDAGSRYMKNPNNQLVPYGLYQDSTHSQPWGDTVGTDTVAGTGNGAIQPLMIYGKVTTTGGNFMAGDDYLDEITATVTY